MPAILVRNISERAHKALKARAKLRGTSAEAEVRAMVEGIAVPKEEVGLGTLLKEFGRRYGALPETKRSKEISTPAIFE
jgi:plasmid stability protein